MALQTSPLSAAQVMGVESSHVVALSNEGEHYLEQSTLNAFLDMQQAAKSDGIDLQICSSFRSFDRQLSIWNRKWAGELPILDKHSRPINTNSLNDHEKIHAIMHWSALPGASRHHWGTDFDVYDKRSVVLSNHKFELIPSEYAQGGPCYKLNKWLEVHATKFGFDRPYEVYTGGVAREPWHYSFSKSAASVIQNFALDSLRVELNKSQILGKQTILELLPSLFNQYTLNLGKA
ncbi:M15 family metallopeptidase [Glaciecola sp. KUL10]|uniref:M15 family metallopeptidase n=1 Tax=Glaciecola sp. (strain KUL10) TaxID=2161813 RepID=UPI000D78C1CB|nr:M15 family metallopeptidase [Glaciecola sp. KUL10]GBL03118.1 D-alanyl-D-alanine carboxypeptidase [Glaciecola sp. KUL10]